MLRNKPLSCLLIGLLGCTSVAHADLRDLSIDELMQIEVTSVSRKPESLADAASAIFVITADDIRRAGARSVPEALRLAPGLHVARIDATKWAITARGFNDRSANKLGETNYVAKALEELIAGSKVSTPETQPYGCSVKYAK